jgi:glycosyltransferase involved in cell wall biosynthesis
VTVLFIGPLPGPVTGQSVACQAFFDELSRAHRVVLVDLSKGTFRQGVSSTSRIAEVAGILRRVWRGRRSADVIYLTVSESYAGNLKDVLIYAICYRQLSRMVIHLHGGAGMRRLMLGGNALVRRVNAFFLRRLGGVVVLGPTHVPIYRGIVPDDRIHVVPNFADDSLFTTPDCVAAKFERRPLRLLFLSNLLPGKGHEELVEAFFALDADTRAAIEIDFAGGFETDEQQARFLAGIAGVENIRYHGTVIGERKRELFDRAHVFCLPTYYPYEGQPISILEAYAAGCAVISTDHSGIPDVFRGDVNGFLVSPRSVPELARAIARAVAETDRVRAMAMSNLEAARTRYRAADYQRSLMDIVGSLSGAQ